MARRRLETIVLAAAAAGACARAATPPSFVFMLSESLDGRLLRPDSAARIPNIRRLLGAGSARFDAAYTPSPVCAPARSALHTGRDVHHLPHVHNGLSVGGVWNNFEGIDPATPLLHDRLNASGYATLVAGKTDWIIGGHSESNELDVTTHYIRWPYNVTQDGGWVEEDPMCGSDGPVRAGGTGGRAGSVYVPDWRIVEAVAAFATTAPRPFYAFSGTSILHPAYSTNEYWFNRTMPQPMPAWAPLGDVHPCDLQAAMKRGCTPGHDNETAYADFYSPARRQRVRQVYIAELEEFDAMVGSVVDALTAAGRWDANTYLILAADHGDMQLEHQMFYKMVAYDASARVPLFVASPALAPLGEHVVAQPVTLLDIVPTVLGLAGVPQPPGLDGHDLAPFLAGAPADPTRPGFVTYQNHDADISSSWFAVVNGTHKLVQYGNGSQVPPQLFDLVADPGEDTNLYNASDAARAAVAALDASLRSVISYPSVAQDVADYQLGMFRYWASHTPGGDWEKAITAPSVRWSQSWLAHPVESKAAVEAYLAQTGPAAIQPCDGRVANIAPAPAAPRSA